MGGTKVAVVGDAMSVAGFRPLGFAVYALEEPSQARDLWPELSSGAYGVVLLNDEVLGVVGDLVRELGAAPLPAVTVIPGAGGQGGLGQARLDQAIVRALGTRAFTREEGD